MKSVLKFFFVSSLVFSGFVFSSAPNYGTRELADMHFFTIPGGHCMINVTIRIYTDGSYDSTTIEICRNPGDYYYPGNSY